VKSGCGTPQVGESVQQLPGAVPQHVVVLVHDGWKTWSRRMATLWLTAMLKIQEDYYGDVGRI
jgi:hypothetical protein